MLCYYNFHANTKGEMVSLTPGFMNFNINLDDLTQI